MCCRIMPKCCRILHCVAVCHLTHLGLVCYRVGRMQVIEACQIYVSATPKYHCNTLQHTTTHDNTRQHTAIKIIEAVRHTSAQLPNIIATQCNTLQHTAAHCNRLQHTQNTDNRGLSDIRQRKSQISLQHNATHGNTLQHR